MRVLITGAGGFVGLPLTRLAASRADVVALVGARTDTALLEAIAPKITIVQGDPGDEAVLDRVAQTKPEACIHAAWYANPADYLDSPRNVDSLHATLRLALRLGAAGCRRFVGVGTCFEYDTSGDAPLRESSPLVPGRLYSACKMGAWHAVQQIGRLAGMSTSWARLFYLYGPREDSRRLVPSVVRALLEGRDAAVSPGAQVRDFLHVEDVASALWAVATSTVEGPVNLGSGHQLTVADLVRMLGAITERPQLVKLGALPYRAGDPMFVCADVQRLFEECHWRPRFSSEAGLRDTVEWWRANQEYKPGRPSHSRR
jgi:nucleoside-diphosphate-sugar epimerase